MKQIIIKNKFIVFVDDEEFERINLHSWNIKRNKRKVYAYTCINSKTIFMHNFIMGIDSIGKVDHENWNGLDNRKENLRICNGTYNNANKDIQINNTSGFKGVYAHNNPRSLKPYRARIGFNHKRILIGDFHTLEEAARAYDAKAIELFGEFACTNEMLGLL